MEPDGERDVQAPMPRRNLIWIALGTLVLLLLLAWFFSSRDPDQDKLIGADTAQGPADSGSELCASRRTYDSIKRELFRRASQLRGSDQAAFDQIAAQAVIRMENPVMESEDEATGAINGSGSLSLDLPPGGAVAGGRRTLSSGVDYSITPAADGSGNVVLLRNADGIVTPLATMGRVAQPMAPADDLLAPDMNATDQPGMVVPGEPGSIEPAPPVDTPPSTASARPSFNCAAARTRGEVAVCSDPRLATLDRQMAAQFNQAMDGAAPQVRAVLQRTRTRFLAYRDSCRSDGCIADAYRGRMREIGDIMAGRWQPR